MSRTYESPSRKAHAEATRQRILRALEVMSDERGYQVLDYVEFLESKYAERQRPTNILAKLTDAVEDTMRAGKVPLKAISTTTGIMDGATKVMKGLAAAGQAVVDEAVKVVESQPAPSQPTPSQPRVEKKSGGSSPA